MAAVCAKCTIIGVQENGDGDLSVKQGLQGPSWLPDVAEYCTSERGKCGNGAQGERETALECRGSDV